MMIYFRAAMSFVLVWIVSISLFAVSSNAKCGSNIYSTNYLIPGPGEKGYDTELAEKARGIDRQFHVFNAMPMGVGVDVTVPVDWKEKRGTIERFLRESDGWDFAKFSGGRTAYDVIGGWQKSAGLYAGVGIAADAMRYAVLRDQNGDCTEIETARAQLLAALDAMHLAFAIPGKPGVVARGFLKKDLPGSAQTIRTMPLKDEAGRPLPLTKNNGVWRDDFSGKYPGYIWEDSISRDQMLGWAMASAVSAEVMRDDASFPQEVKDRLKSDAATVCRAMRARTKGGYDLEFPDADGRTTLYGHLNENNLDGQYIPGLKNGFYAVMALGIYGAFSFAAQDNEAEKYLYDVLIAKRKLPALAADHMKFVDMGKGSNFSNYNMAFTSAWLALRYLRDDAALVQLGKAMETQLYNRTGAERQPVEMKQSLFDLIYAGAKTEGTVYAPPTAKPDEGVVGRALETLKEFQSAPLWEVGRKNCDEKEIASRDCTLDDGTKVRVFSGAGWDGDLVAERPIPMRVRPPSNYYWRSNPYAPNGEAGGDRMVTGVDFRIAYWLGRWTQAPANQ